MGADSDYLKKYGYQVTEVPNADPQVDRCSPLVGNERIQCWADFDKYIMEEVVPWVPYLFDNNIDIISERVVNYTYDAFAGVASLSHMAVRPGAE